MLIIYLKLNIVISVACHWISLKYHRCISTSLIRRCKNKVLNTIVWWFSRCGAPVILRVKRQKSLTVSAKNCHFLGYYNLKLQFRALCEIPRTRMGSLKYLNGLLRTIFEVITCFPSANIRTLSMIDSVSVFSFIFAIFIKSFTFLIQSDFSSSRIVS